MKFVGYNERERERKRAPNILTDLRVNYVHFYVITIQESRNILLILRFRINYILHNNRQREIKRGPNIFSRIFV